MLHPLEVMGVGGLMIGLLMRYPMSVKVGVPGMFLSV
jgi:hypothetical protein